MTKYTMQVLRLPAVGSKRFLTTKVDRCVTGDIALYSLSKGRHNWSAVCLPCKQWLGFQPVGTHGRGINTCNSFAM